MAQPLPLAQVNRLVLHKQHLPTSSGMVSIVQGVQDIGGLHATTPAVPYLSLWARGAASPKEELHAALYDQRSLAKVLCMRNTLFILPKALLPVAYQATKTRRRALLRRYLSHYGITDEEYQRGCAAVAELLAAGGRTTVEIKQELRDPAMAVMVDLMPEDWRLVRARPRGTWRSSQHEYVPFEDWFPDVELDSLNVDEAQTRLVWFYLSCFGPATEEDVVWWTGFGKTEVRRAVSELADRLVEVEIEGLGGGYLLPASDLESLMGIQQDDRRLWFLPNLDPCIMGYKNRSRFLHPSKYDRVFDPSGNALPTVWYDGQVVGIWLQERKARPAQVLLFEEPAAVHLRHQTEEQARHLSRFLEQSAANFEIKPYPQDLYAKTPFNLGRRA